MNTTVAKLDFKASASDATLAAGASITMLLKCPAGIFGADLKVQASTTAAGSVSLFEAPTTSADGTANPAECMSRLDTPPACPVLISLGPTVSDDGTLLERGSTALGDRFGSEAWLLKPGTNYLVRLTNNSGAPCSAVLSVQFTIIPDLDLFRALNK